MFAGVVYDVRLSLSHINRTLDEKDLAGIKTGTYSNGTSHEDLSYTRWWWW
jgi:hypothetical protein